MTRKKPGLALELYFVDGTPDGMLTAALSNWTGHVLVTPRTQLAEALTRPESSRAGVYILLGESENDDPRTVAYIGEGENVANRIKAHDANRDWWTQVILITSDSRRLNKAHVKYLESRLVEEGQKVGKLKLINDQTPTRAGLTEADEATMEQFLDHVLTILPAIRVDGFFLKARPATTPVEQNLPPDLEEVDTIFEMSTPTNNVSGVAVLQNGEFVVQPGSVGRNRWTGPESHGYKKLFDEVVASGAFENQGPNRVFTQAYAFSSPSAAGAVLNGRVTNGPAVWHLSTDPTVSYRQWEEARLQM